MSARLIGDAIDLDPHVSLEEAGFDGGASGLDGAEKFGVDLVHFVKLAGVAQEDGTLDHVLQARAATRQNLGQIQKSLAGLLLDIAEGVLIVIIDRTQSADENEIAGADR